MKTFYHGGDFGDIIYSLPFIEAEGGGHLLLGRDVRCRLQLDPETVEVIAPLLRLQSYITTVSFVLEKPVDAVNLTLIRDYWAILKRQRLNLVESYFHVFKKPVPPDKPWLEVPSLPLPSPFRNLVHRSPRWHDPSWPWQAFMDRWREMTAFVGLRPEYEAFVQEFGPVAYLPTADLLELARSIRSCELFTGNQSAPMAIALGLGVPTLTEYWPEWPNVFVRS